MLWGGANVCQASYGVPEFPLPAWQSRFGCNCSEFCLAARKSFYRVLALQLCVVILALPSICCLPLPFPTLPYPTLPCPYCWRQKFWLRCEHITGPLPPDYPTAMPHLTSLELLNLNLTGSLPGSWRGWSSLQDVRVFANQVP